MYDEIIVPTIRLVDFINFLNVEDNSIVLKLDVEGAEYQILKDMKKSNIFNKIKKLHVEFHEWGRNPEY
nr:FkbM family methyltransferase [Nitrosarchaeum sp.]